MVADCKSAGLTPYVGSNPTPTTQADGRAGDRDWQHAVADGSELKGSRDNRPPAGVAQLVEHQPSKLRVAGSSPVARFVARVAQVVERILGKDEVRGSIPRASLQSESQIES